jgi:hypothetical protein
MFEAPIPKGLIAGVEDDETPLPKRSSLPTPKRRGRKPITKLNWLRPRYIKVIDDKLHVTPRLLAYSTRTTLDGSGAPVFDKPYILPISENSLYDAEYHKNDRKRYMIDSVRQWRMFKEFFRKQPEPGLYVITAEIRNRPVLQVLVTMLMHAVQATGCRQVHWRSLYSVREASVDKFNSRDVLVLSNVHDQMDDVKFTHLRDLLDRFREHPVFILVDGIDPLEFSLSYVRIVPKLVLSIGWTRVPVFIRQI